MCYEGLNDWLRLKDGGKGSRVSTVQPSLMDASLITWNQEEGADADGHGKDREAIEDRRDAMSGLLFSSEAVGRALVFLLSQPLLFTIPQQPVQTLGVILMLLHRIPLSLPVLSKYRYSF